MVPILAAVAIGQSLPAVPIAEEVSRGRSIGLRLDQDRWELQLGRTRPATAQLARIDEIYLADRQIIGTWNEGVRDLDVEWVIQLSPALLSRWLGFLSARELWPDGETAARWRDLRAQLGNRPAYVVVLSAFPKKTLFGLGDDEKPQTDEIDNVRIVFESEGRQIEASTHEFYRQRAKTRSELDTVPWWQFTTLRETFQSQFESEFEPPLVPRGDYHRSWRWVVPAQELSEAGVTVKIASRRKIRTAVFPAPAPSSSGT